MLKGLTQYRIVQVNANQLYAVQKKVWVLPWYNAASGFATSQSAKGWLGQHLGGGKKAAKFTVVEEVKTGVK